MEVFKKLSKEEIDALHLAPALVTILIGAADGKLDKEERIWSEKLMRAKGLFGDGLLTEYYQEVAEGLWVDIQHEMSVLPTTIEERSQLIVSRLEKLNPILAKLDAEVAYLLYHGLLSLAKEVAKASGGFLRIGAVSAAEYVLVELPMLTPIEAPEGMVAPVDHDANIWGEKPED